MILRWLRIKYHKRLVLYKMLGIKKRILQARKVEELSMMIRNCKTNKILKIIKINKKEKV